MSSHGSPLPVGSELVIGLVPAMTSKGGHLVDGVLDLIAHPADVAEPLILECHPVARFPPGACGPGSGKVPSATG